MYTIAIIDDESIIRRGIAQSIDWNDLGYEVVGTASDGEEGLALMKEKKPDIVISDIRMPVLDGLEMVRQARRLHLPCSFILMSGYEEFRYAQCAVNLKVEKYLLKPIDNEELLKVVRRVTRQIEAERKLERQISESMPLLRHNFVARLLSGRMTEEEIASELGFLDIELSAYQYLVLMIKVDDYREEPYVSHIQRQEVLKFGIFNIVQEVFGADSQFSPCPDGEKNLPIYDERVENIHSGGLQQVLFHDTGGDELVVIAGCGEGEEGPALRRIYQLCEELSLKTGENLSTTVTIGMGRFRKGYQGIARSCAEAASAIECRHMEGKNRIISIQDIHLPGRRDSISISDLEKKVLSSIKIGLVEETNKSLEGIRTRILEQEFVTLEKMRLIGMELSILLIKEAENWTNQNSERSHLEELNGLSSSVMSKETLDDIFQVLFALVEKIARGINAQRISQQKEIIDQAIAYINANYGSEDLSLQDVAQNVHISSSYFSTIFKKEKNINFTDYLTETRMKKSMELLRNTNLKAYEIARMVGYSNPQYFSLCFKKYTGYSPLQFKNI